MNRIFAITILILAFSLNAKSPTKLDFCKKWNLVGYIYQRITFSPEETEINDYLNFNEDGTFISIHEGKRNLEMGFQKINHFIYTIANQKNH